MIYVEEKSQDKQLELIKYFSNYDEFTIIIWLYPECKITDLFSLAISNSLNYNSVTTYSDGYKPFATLPKCLNKKMIKLLNKNKNIIHEYCDSIVLYKGDDKDWFMSTIGHEGMCLVKDDMLLEELKKEGFSCSLESPDWW